MAVALAGTNHRTSPLWLREKAALSGVRLFDTRKRLFGLPGITEVAVVSTCNRVEFYAAGPELAGLQESLTSFLGEEFALSAEEFEAYFYVAEGLEAVRHLFLVAVGADSMVVGESQVAGQVQRAFGMAREEGTLGPELEELAQGVEAVVDRVALETDFGKSPVTVGSVAVEMAREILGSLKPRAAMILGAGELGILTARALAGNGIGTILVANRTLSRAQEVAHHLGGRAVDYEELSAQIEKVDILVASTSAPHILIKKAMLEKILAVRPKRPLFIIDLAVPRNVDPAAAELPQVTLINVDDLQEVARRNTEERLAQLPRVQAIVREEAERHFSSRSGRRLSLLDLPLG